MADYKQLEFFLLRYVPDAVKGEFVNIGLLMREPGEGDGRFSAVRITEDWSRVRCIDPEADLEVLTGMGLQLQRELAETQDWNLLIRKLEDLFSNVIQVSPVKACLAEDAAKEADVLERLYLQTARRAAKGVVSGRQRILKGMESAFESAGVLKLMQRGISVAEYTRKIGDPLRFDFGYGVGDEVKFLQAVSLKGNLQLAIGLGVRFPGVARDIREARQVESHLTVVVEDDLNRGEQEVGFVLGLMEENRIRVAAVGEMAGIAAEVRGELRA